MKFTICCLNVQYLYSTNHKTKRMYCVVALHKSRKINPILYYDYPTRIKYKYIYSCGYIYGQYIYY